MSGTMCCICWGICLEGSCSHEGCTFACFKFMYQCKECSSALSNHACCPQSRLISAFKEHSLSVGFLFCWYGAVRALSGLAGLPSNMSFFSFVCLEMSQSTGRI